MLQGHQVIILRIMKILIFAFKGTIAEKVACLLDNQFDKNIVKSSVSDIESFIRETNFTYYNYILGMGKYSGRDTNALRIETICSSKFRNSKSKIATKPIPYFLQPSDGIKLARGIGNSWCNLVSYKLVREFPKKPYTFVHIPRSYDPRTAISSLEKQLVRVE